MIKPLSNLIFNCNSNKDYFDTLQILENHLISFILEKRLLDIISSYLFDEIVLFNSVLLNECVDCRLEKNGSFVMIKKIYISSGNYGYDDKVEYQQITITPTGELKAKYHTNFHYTKDPEYTTCSGITSRTNSMSVNCDKNDIYTFSTYNNPEREYQILATFHDYEEDLDEDFNFMLLSIPDSTVDYNYIIANGNAVFLMDTNKNRLEIIFSFADERCSLISRIFQHKNNFLVICHQSTSLIIMGDLDNIGELVSINLSEVFKSVTLKDKDKDKEKDKIWYYTTYCNNTSDKRYVGMFGTISVSLSTDKKNNNIKNSNTQHFICIIDMLEKKMKTKLIKQIPRVIWTINGNSMIVITSKGKIIQYFL